MMNFGFVSENKHLKAETQKTYILILYRSSRCCNRSWDTARDAITKRGADGVNLHNKENKITLEYNFHS